MIRAIRSSGGLFVILMLITGLGFPMVTLVIGQVLFPYQANGSLIKDNGKIIGSELIGQNFTGEAYFHPRPSSAGTGYDASNSSGSNMGPTSEDLAKAVTDRVMAFKKTGDFISIPVDLITASASGLDPHISPAGARFQAPRIAEARHMTPIQVQELITQYTWLPPLGVLGDARVNVLVLNRALDQIAPLKP